MARKRKNNQQVQQRYQQDNYYEDDRFQQKAQAKPGKKKKPVTAGKAFFLGLFAAFIMVLLFAALLIFYRALNDNAQAYRLQEQIDAAVNQVKEASSQVQLSAVPSARQAALDPNVNITVTREKDNVQTKSYGSGVVISSDGLIVTNYHVVKDAKTIECEIGGETYKGEVPGYDDMTDIAVIKVDAKNLVSAKVQTGEVGVGEWVMSAGNPYGYTDTLTNGNISALHRNFTLNDGPVAITYANMIQTSTQVREGSSGGGLYNATGELVGLNTLIEKEEAHADSIGYAIPINFVIPITERLKNGKLAKHAALGVQYGDVPEDIVVKYGLTSDDGAVCKAVTASSAAETAGIVANDIITKINDESVKDAMDAYYTIYAMQPSDTVTLTVLREGKEMTFKEVRLGSDVE